jgi:hypothetical protein
MDTAAATERELATKADKVASIFVQHSRFKEQRIRCIISYLDPDSQQQPRRDVKDIARLIFEYLDSKRLTCIYPDLFASGDAHKLYMSDFNLHPQQMRASSIDRCSPALLNLNTFSLLSMGLRFDSGFLALSVFIRPRGPCFRWDELKGEVAMFITCNRFEPLPFIQIIHFDCIFLEK